MLWILGSKSTLFLLSSYSCLQVALQLRGRWQKLAMSGAPQLNQTRFLYLPIETPGSPRAVTANSRFPSKLRNMYTPHVCLQLCSTCWDYLQAQLRLCSTCCFYLQAYPTMTRLRHKQNHAQIWTQINAPNCMLAQPLAPAHAQWQRMLDASPQLATALQMVTTIAQATILQPGAFFVCCWWVTE